VAGLLIGAVAATPLLVALVFVALHRPVIHFADDRAMLELAVRRAAHGRQLIGNGTRWGWADLGPAAFYALVPAYLATHQSPFGIDIGVIALHALSVLALVFLVGARRGAAGAALVAALVVAYIAAMGTTILTNVWVPWMVMLPLLVLVFLAGLWVAGEGGRWALAVAVVVGSALVQAKPEMLVVVSFLAVAAVLLRVVLVRRTGRAWRRGALLAGVVALGVMWTLPLIEQFTAPSGNFTKVVRFAWHGALGQGPAHVENGRSFAQAVSALGEILSVFPRAAAHVVFNVTFAHDTAHGPLWSYLVAGGYALGALVVAVVARSRREPWAEAVAWLALVGMAAAVAWTTHLLGAFEPFLVVWGSVLPVALWAAAGLLALPALDRVLHALGRFMAADLGAGSVRLAQLPAHSLAAVLVVVTAIMAAHHGVSFHGAPAYNHARSAEVETLTDFVNASLRPEESVEVRIRGARPWLDATGVVLELVKAGRQVSIEDAWLSYFGEEFRVRRVPDETVLFSVASLGVPPEVRLLGAAGDVAVSLAR